jgi:hypothetical protein
VQSDEVDDDIQSLRLHLVTSPGLRLRLNPTRILAIPLCSVANSASVSDLNYAIFLFVGLVQKLQTRIVSLESIGGLHFLCQQSGIEFHFCTAVFSIGTLLRSADTYVQPGLKDNLVRRNSAAINFLS